MSTKRYVCGAGDGMYESREGYWVEYTEYLKLLKEIKLLKEKLKVKIK